VPAGEFFAVGETVAVSVDDRGIRDGLAEFPAAVPLAERGIFCVRQAVAVATGPLDQGVQPALLRRTEVSDVDIEAVVEILVVQRLADRIAVDDPPGSVERQAAGIRQLRRDPRLDVPNGRAQRISGLRERRDGLREFPAVELARELLELRTAPEWRGSRDSYYSKYL